MTKTYQQPHKKKQDAAGVLWFENKMCIYQFVFFGNESLFM